MAGEATAAGAAVGTAIFPGVGTAVGALVGSFMEGDSGGASSPGSYTPRTADAAVYGSGLDGSGWNVNFGGTQSNGSNKNGAQPSVMEGLGLSAPGAGLSPLLLWGGLAFVALVIWKRSKSAK